jgi:LacI family transcriptional regulator
MPLSRAAKTASSPVINLKILSKHLKLTPGTISVVLNDTPRASEIPLETRNRILAAAKKFNYRPNHLARSLRNRRSAIVGILAPEVSEGYGALLLNAISEYLIQKKYFYFVATHRRRPELLEEYARMLTERSVEGFIVIDTVLNSPLPLPAVAISGHKKFPGLTNVILDHRHAAKLALQHLHELGHERIVFMRGQPFSADSRDRWKATAQVAAQFGIKTQSESTIQLTMDTFSPEVGYPAMQEFLTRRKDFTALLAYNDFSAIGAVRALREAGLRVPEDVSVMGFDDVNSAAYQNPSLTTIRQPLQRMAEIAAQILLDRLDGRDFPKRVLLKPELIVRESTARAKGSA